MSKELGTIQQDVLEHFNRVTGRKFQKPKGLASILKAGYTVEDVKLVIEYQAKEWMGTDMQKYLRPETLFRESKFEGYLNNAMQRVDLVEQAQKENEPMKTSEMPMEYHFSTKWAADLI